MIMGILKNGIYAGFSGKVGPIVGASWRGMDVVRTMPKKSTKPPSAAQLLQRAKFTAAMAFLQPLKPFLAAYFGKKEGTKSPFDLALSYHLRQAIKVENMALVWDYPKVCISKGHLRGVEGASAVMQAGNVLRLHWLDNSNQSFASRGDMLTIVLFIPSSASFFYFENISLRQDATVEVSLPEEAVGTELHCWATFITHSGSQAATSCYISFEG